MLPSNVAESPHIGKSRKLVCRVMFIIDSICVNKPSPSAHIATYLRGKVWRRSLKLWGGRREAQEWEGVRKASCKLWLLKTKKKGALPV